MVYGSPVVMLGKQQQSTQRNEVILGGLRMPQLSKFSYIDDDCRTSLEDLKTREIDPLNTLLEPLKTPAVTLNQALI